MVPLILGNPYLTAYITPPRFNEGGLESRGFRSGEVDLGTEQLSRPQGVAGSWFRGFRGSMV